MSVPASVCVCVNRISFPLPGSVGGRAFFCRDSIRAGAYAAQIHVFVPRPLLMDRRQLRGTTEGILWTFRDALGHLCFQADRLPVRGHTLFVWPRTWGQGPSAFDRISRKPRTRLRLGKNTYTLGKTANVSALATRVAPSPSPSLPLSLSPSLPLPLPLAPARRSGDVARRRPSVAKPEHPRRPNPVSGALEAQGPMLG